MSRLPQGLHHLTPTISVHVFDALEPGPTALIQAGIHGDEIAGVHALQELLEEDIRPRRGRLIIIPVMNPAAYRARQRCAPGGLDLAAVVVDDRAVADGSAGVSGVRGVGRMSGLVRHRKAVRRTSVRANIGQRGEAWRRTRKDPAISRSS